MSILSDLGNLKWGQWLYTLIAAGISAGASVIVSNPLATLFGAQQYSPRQLGINAGAMALVAMAGILKKSPLPDRKVEIALLPGVHTMAEVNTVDKATGPGVIPTPEIAAAALGKPMPPEVPQ